MKVDKQLVHQAAETIKLTIRVPVVVTPFATNYGGAYFQVSRTHEKDDTWKYGATIVYSNDIEAFEVKKTGTLDNATIPPEYFITAGLVHEVGHALFAQKIGFHAYFNMESSLCSPERLLEETRAWNDGFKWVVQNRLYREPWWNMDAFFLLRYDCLSAYAKYQKGW